MWRCWLGPGNVRIPPVGRQDRQARVLPVWRSCLIVAFRSAKSLPFKKPNPKTFRGAKGDNKSDPKIHRTARSLGSSKSNRYRTWLYSYRGVACGLPLNWFVYVPSK
jgi:hypothetical protein